MGAFLLAYVVGCCAGSSNWDPMPAASLHTAELHAQLLGAADTAKGCHLWSVWVR